MGSAMGTGNLGSYTTSSASLAQVLSRELNAPAKSQARPIVFVVDGDGSVRESLELLIRRENWQCETFPSTHEFLAGPRVLVPNCLVLDVSLPEFNGLEFQRRVAIERPDMSIISIASQIDMLSTVQAIKARAFEFFLKPVREDLLLSAIREALERSRLALGQEAEIRVVRNSYASLSSREREVMGLLASGLLNKQVGGDLGISEHTVKVHRGRVMQKMQAASFAHLVRMAAKLGIGLPRKSQCDELSYATFV